MEFTGFLTQFRKPERFHSNVGSPIRTTYSASYDDKGRIRLEESGTENLYDYIQSFAESCDIHVLLKRFANGETDVLSRVQGFYADVTELPQTYADISLQSTFPTRFSFTTIYMYKRRIKTKTTRLRKRFT